ncbi:hypothetical protein ACFWM0_19050 [Streptomyces sp. NPDC058405]|uniref:hypothetical protein n=1 Tax=Streptomyces sp. NPDC058405 TaxID=3346482 RepID=UPI00366918DC
MTRDHSPAPRLGREGLGRALVETCAMSLDWAPTFAAVDRAAFLPGLVWPFDMERGTSVTVDRAADPGAWYAAADSNIPIVTQWDDGKHTGTEPGRVSTSSSSMPSVVYAMLRTLALDDGMRVLDVGTGTGETAGALFHRCGPGRVTTIEVDRSVSEQAHERLTTDCVQAVADKREGARPVWFYGLSDRSWACVMFRDGESEAAVWQSGPRRLWDEVEDAYRWWVDRGEPEHTRFGLTVTPDGQRAWIDSPAESWAI